MRVPETVSVPAALVADGPPAGAVVFEDVRFRYPGGSDRDVLRGVSLSIAAGETVALVGTTGAGKSTIVKLLARCYPPTGGRLLVDGTPIEDWGAAAYHRRVGYVPQEPFLFADTVHGNIAYARPEASHEEIERAARAVGAHEVIARLPGGYEHRVGERGSTLSAGQRQLICLARAELLEPAILLLDEATASLDPVSEAAVTAAMRAMAGRRTTVLIAHRLETARLADRIAVVHDGQIVETGSHEELLDQAGRYATMWRYACAKEDAVVGQVADRG